MTGYNRYSLGTGMMGERWRGKRAVWAHSRTVLSVTVVLALGVSCAVNRASHSPLETALSAPPAVDNGLVYGIPCQPPCWQNILPGESAAQDVEREVERLLAGGAAYSVRSSGENYHIRTSSTSEGSHGIVYVLVDDGIVTSIRSNVAFDYYANTLVEQVGEPEAIYRPGGRGACHGCEGEDPLGFATHLLYPSKGLWFMALPSQGCICPETRVTAFCYYAPMSLEDVMKDDYLTRLCGVQLHGVREDLLEWSGFGKPYGP